MNNRPFIFFGTPYVASDTLARLLNAGYKPLAVVTNPPAPVGRGRVITPSPTHTLAQENSIPVFTPEKITSEFIQELQELNADYALVVAYGKILPQELIDIFPLGLLNIHYSLLPKYRGASPVEAALLNGDTVTGVSIQKLALEMDAGDILVQKEETVLRDDTTTTLRARLIELGASALVDILSSFENGTATFVPQDHTQATRCRKIKKEEGELDLLSDAQTNWNKYRAYIENPGTYFFVAQGDKKVRVKIKSAKLEKGVFTPLRVVPENKSEMDYSVFLKSINS